MNAKQTNTLPLARVFRSFWHDRRIDAGLYSFQPATSINTDKKIIRMNLLFSVCAVGAENCQIQRLISVRTDGK